MSDVATIPSTVLEHLCRKNTVLLYVFFDELDDFEYEIGHVTDDTDDLLTIHWRVIKSSSGCQGLTWNDHFIRGELPTAGRWLHQLPPLAQMIQGLPDDGLIWCYTYINRLQ
jgi:hypothetical protein